MGCVVGYLVLTFQLGRWDTQRGDTLLETRTKDGNRLRIRSNIHVTGKGDCEYEIVAENLSEKGKSGSFKVSITEFIDSEGRFYKNLFSNKANELLDKVITSKKTQ